VEASLGRSVKQVSLFSFWQLLALFVFHTLLTRLFFSAFLVKPHFLGSCVSKTFLTSSLVSYPWDVIRRRQQTWGFAPGTKDLGNVGTLQAFRAIVEAEGFFSLWRGISINYIKATPTVAIAFTVYETVNSHLKRTVL
jgi:hypothetical protein